MICPDCFKGYVLRRSFPGNEVFPYPCETCGGSGVSYCCDGTDIDCAVPRETVEPRVRTE